MPDRNEASPGGSEVAEGLRAMVADTFALMAKTQGFHWNMRGAGFIGLHKLTEAQYQEMFQAVDDLAERLRALDFLAPTGLSEIDDLASVDDAPLRPDTTQAATILAEDNMTLATRAGELAGMADDAGDAATHDMLVERVAVHQKAAWLLRGHLL